MSKPPDHLNVKLIVLSCSFSSGGLFGGTGDFFELVDTDVVVGPSGEQVSSVLVPGKGSATKRFLGDSSFVVLHGEFFNLLQEGRAWEIQDPDALLGSDDEPVQLLGEEHAVDWGVAFLVGQPLAFDEIPDHDGSVTGAGGEVRGAVYHVEGVNLSLVAGEGVHKVHVEVVPNLDGLVPGGGDADGGLLGVVELDARDGIGVLVLVNGMLAL